MKRFYLCDDSCFFSANVVIPSFRFEMSRRHCYRFNVDQETAQKTVEKFLNTVRGSRSQAALSQSLGFSYNLYNRWENGTQTFFWRDFVTLAKFEGWNLEEAIRPVDATKGLAGQPTHELIETKRTTLHLASVFHFRFSSSRPTP